MKKIILVALLFLTARICSAQYKPVDDGSALKFTIGNFGFDVNGSFAGFMGKITFDEQNPTASSFDVTIEAATVNTDNQLRDKHLKEEGYFDVANYPRIRLVSGSISGSKNNYRFKGKLIIKGVSKDISFPFTAAATSDGYTFHGTFKINRKDFNVGGTSTIANELEVSLNVHAVKTQAT
jgi:polyisoprenoid-binding protein YceI